MSVVEISTITDVLQKNWFTWLGPKDVVFDSNVELPLRARLRVLCSILIYGEDHFAQNWHIHNVWG